MLTKFTTVAFASLSILSASSFVSAAYPFSAGSDRATETQLMALAQLDLQLARQSVRRIDTPTVYSLGQYHLVLTSVRHRNDQARGLFVLTKSDGVWTLPLQTTGLPDQPETVVRR
jgi:hypothetical protein